MTLQEAYRMAFIWAYKACPCCGRVIPDSRRDELGKCQLCQVPRKLVDMPIGWDEPYEVRDNEGNLQRITTLWMHAWQNRPPEKFCEHERKGMGLK